MKASEYLDKALAAGPLRKLDVPTMTKAGQLGPQTPLEAALAERAAYASRHPEPDSRDRDILRDLDEHVERCESRERYARVVAQVKAALPPRTDGPPT